MQDDEYLHGVLTICYGCSMRGSLFLKHKVNGRFSEMELDDGDIIKVFDGEEYKPITVESVIETTVNKSEDNAFKNYSVGQSLYEGRRAMVMINPATTQIIHTSYKKQFMADLFKNVESESITHEEAMEILARWEQVYEAGE